MAVLELGFQLLDLLLCPRSCQLLPLPFHSCLLTQALGIQF